MQTLPSKILNRAVASVKRFAGENVFSIRMTLFPPFDITLLVFVFHNCSIYHLAFRNASTKFHLNNFLFSYFLIFAKRLSKLSLFTILLEYSLFLNSYVT